MFTIEQLLRYFKKCTEHVNKEDRQKVFDELSTYLEYWGSMSKKYIEQEFKAAGIL
jgi:hypothetical protein